MKKSLRLDELEAAVGPVDMAQKVEYGGRRWTVILIRREANQALLED